MACTVVGNFDVPGVAGDTLSKICHVATVDISIRFLLLNQLLFLKEKGLQIHVACSDGKWLEEIEGHGIVVHRIEMRRSISPHMDLFSLFSLVRLFRREKFSLVHLHTPKASLLGAIAAKLSGVPKVVYTIHGFYFHDGMKWPARSFFVFWEKIISMCVDSALSQNRADVGTAINSGLYREGKISFLGNGIDIVRFDPEKVSTDQRLRTRRSFGISGTCPVVGVVARLVREKGLLDLFESIVMLKREFPNVHLLLVGPADGKRKDGIAQDTAAYFGLKEDITFTGMRLDLPELLSIMDVFVLPSYREGFPRALMEASSMRLPVVATDIRGCREAVEDGVTGLLVPVGDPKGLAAGIAAILRDRAFAERLGNAGRRKALSDFDELAVFRKAYETYQRLGQKD